MATKKKNAPENLEQSPNEEKKSEEFLRFEEGLRAIFSLSPEEAKRIRESPLPPDPDEQENEANS